jgi:hypothetical protein
MSDRLNCSRLAEPIFSGRVVQLVAELDFRSWRTRFENANRCCIHRRLMQAAQRQALMRTVVTETTVIDWFIFLTACPVTSALCQRKIFSKFI